MLNESEGHREASLPVCLPQGRAYGEEAWSDASACDLSMTRGDTRTTASHADEPPSNPSKPQKQPPWLHFPPRLYSDL